MKCPNCRTVMEHRTGAVQYNDCGLEGITVEGVELHSCPKCGETTQGFHRIEELQRTIALTLAERPERLGPAEVKYLRKYLGLSSADFARKMSFTPSTVSRLESKDKPQAMGEPAEKLLRMLVLTERPIEEYPLEEMASKDEKTVRMRLEPTSGGWRAQV